MHTKAQIQQHIHINTYTITDIRNHIFIHHDLYNNGCTTTSVNIRYTNKYTATPIQQQIYSNIATTTHNTRVQLHVYASIYTPTSVHQHPYNNTTKPAHIKQHTYNSTCNTTYTQQPLYNSSLNTTHLHQRNYATTSRQHDLERYIYNTTITTTHTL